jgi:hypothetical protein
MLAKIIKHKFKLAADETGTFNTGPQPAQTTGTFAQKASA